MAQYGISIEESNKMAVFEVDAYISLIEELQNKEKKENTTLSNS